MTIPGQTMGMAVFTDHFIEAFGLSRTQLSIAYLVGTAASAFFLSSAGRQYDAFGARLVILIVSISLGICLLFISSIDYLSDRINGVLGIQYAGTSFVLIVIGYFGVRFTGQGILHNASANVLLPWFSRRRGLVIGARSVFVVLGFSVAPIVLVALIDTYGWRYSLCILAALVGLLYGILALTFVRNSPESCGLLPDGKTLEAEETAALEVPSKSAGEAKRSPVFWLYSLALGTYSFFGTAVVFHIASIFAEAGRSSVEAFGYFVPQAIVSVVSNILGSWLSDSWPLRRLLIIKLVAFAIGAGGLCFLHHDLGYWLLVVGFGVCSGIWGILFNITFVRFFGIGSIGEISGLNLSLSVAGSAIGPVVFSVARDGFESYTVAVIITLVLVLGLLCAAILLDQTEPAPVRPSAPPPTD